MNEKVEGICVAVQNGTETIRVRHEGNVTYITLTREQSYNSLNPQMMKELTSALKDVAHSEADILVIEGAGPGFCAGGDIRWMLQEASGDEQFFQMMDLISEMVLTLYCMPKLTIAAVHGAAAGLGFSLALATDHIIADEQANFAMNFIGIGLIPDGGGHFLLERRIGEHKAKRLIWEGTKLPAQAVFAQGLIDEVCVNLQEAVAARIQQWRSKPIAAMIKTKKIYAETNRRALLNTLELEKFAQHKMRQTEDHLEGIQAFVEKRRPEFKGR